MTATTRSPTAPAPTWSSPGNGRNAITIYGSRNVVVVGDGDGNRITVKGTKKGKKVRRTIGNVVTIGDGSANRVTVGRGSANQITVGDGARNRVTVRKGSANVATSATAPGTASPSTAARTA